MQKKSRMRYKPNDQTLDMASLYAMKHNRVTLCFYHKNCMWCREEIHSTWSTLRLSEVSNHFKCFQEVADARCKSIVS